MSDSATAERIRVAAVAPSVDGLIHIGNLGGRIVLHIGEALARELLEGRRLCCATRDELTRALELAYPIAATEQSGSGTHSERHPALRQ